MKIAFVAMSGIRVCDTKLLELGLTLPGFVERSQTIASLPSLGLLTLAGMTPKEHDVHYIEIPNLSESQMSFDGFDLVAISSYSAQIQEAYDLAERCQKNKIPVVLGGPHVSVLPEEALGYCDAVVLGEGEYSWLQVLEDCQNGIMSGCYGKTNNPYELTDAPLPAYEHLDIANYNRLTVQTSRGCPHHCEFCAGSVLLTDRYKQKPISKVLAEIDKILSIWPTPFIEFADDNSFVNKDYWKELLGELDGRHFKWFTETDLSVSSDSELLDRMRQTGCSQILIGLESPVISGLGGLELHNDWKFRNYSGYRDAIQTIQDHGITVNGCFILGLDGHTPDIFDQVYDFVRETKLYEVQVTILTPFPGTPLYLRLEKEGRLLHPKQWQRCTLFDVNFAPSHMTSDELADGFKGLVAKLYDDEFIRWRRNQFHKQRKKYLKNKESSYEN
jgi:radical SAM superfamily enzyme YgiQ (UPF0313 family)